jgi:hypothetical protein
LRLSMGAIDRPRRANENERRADDGTDSISKRLKNFTHSGVC